MNSSVLKQYGIDYEKGLARCINDEAFYIQMLELFLNDDAFSRAKTAVENKDYRALFDCVHEMKGACGNIDLTDLYADVCVLVELVRHEGAPEVEIVAAFEKMEVSYQRAVEGIKKAIQ